MLRRKLLAILIPIISFIIAANMAVCPVYGSESRMPHLIQTVSERDIFEGMLALGFLESPVLDEADCDRAYENVHDCIVRISMGRAYGSGIIWKITSDNVIIATNKHVLEYWDEQISNVRFSQGYYASAEILGVSEEYDVGFLKVDNKELDYTQLEQLRYVHYDMDSYSNMREGDEIFCVGTKGIYSADDEDDILRGEIYFKGSIGSMWQYIDEFGEYMIYGYGYGTPGVSGGGTFDARGNLIGMISGGTEIGETASVPLTVIIEAYDKIDGIK